MEIAPPVVSQTSCAVRILPDTVANQIAAGEVVERPSSVVKELVENSLDAGARRVYVSIRHGGKSFIEVVDDGWGMGRDDAMMAFERHATSKIRDAADLQCVTTLGFRGEALPSIASVSRVTLSTARGGASAGSEIVIEGGVLKEVRDSAPIKGTRIQVRDLFLNVPARRKFLRSEQTESTSVEEVVIRQALARPGAGFTFIRDGRPVFETEPGGAGEGLLGRIASLFGDGMEERLMPVRREAFGMRVSGFVSRPGYYKSSGEAQYVYINGRFVRDRLVNLAVNEGFHSLAPKGLRPMAFLFLDMPGGMVDVNVHPAKLEARFVDGRAVVSLVKGAILEALMAGNRGGEAPAPAAAAPSAANGPAHGWAPHFNSPPPMVHRPAFAEPVAAMEAPVERGLTPQTPDSRDVAAALKMFTGGAPREFSVVGQVFKTFILVEEAGGQLLLLDQHTAHERILHERLTRKYREGRIESQDLLFPAEVRFSRSDARIAAESREIFDRLGFVLEEFGGDTFAIRSAPSILMGKDLSAVAVGVVSSIAVGREGGLDRVAEEAINIMACRGAVKAGQRLDPREMEALVAQLKDCALPYTCPHGRPVALSITQEDLLKLFLRK
ncbi:MAG: DNA mismatch repair endonuclease MutL [Nitrospinae bacterium]|nr:DNA mismatch repair endonuclease MutL [Nitrospinota bacterium]